MGWGRMDVAEEVEVEVAEGLIKRWGGQRNDVEVGVLR